MGASQCSSLLWGMYFQGGLEHELLTQRQEGDREWYEGGMDQQQEKTWGLVAEGVGVGMEVFWIILTRRMGLYLGRGMS